jgi:hypothetical protein
LQAAWSYDDDFEKTMLEYMEACGHLEACADLEGNGKLEA